MTLTIDSWIDSLVTCTRSHRFHLSGNVDIHGATFKKDFGPWKKGDYAELLCLDLENLTLQEFDIEKADYVADGFPHYNKSCDLVIAAKEPHDQSISG